MDWFDYQFAFTGSRKELEDLIEKLELVERVGLLRRIDKWVEREELASHSASQPKECAPEPKPAESKPIEVDLDPLIMKTQTEILGYLEKAKRLPHWVCRYGDPTVLPFLFGYKLADKDFPHVGGLWNAKNPGETYELLTAKDGTLYFKMVISHPQGVSLVLKDFLESQYQTIRIYWNFDCETDDTQHLFFTEEDLTRYKDPYKEYYDDEGNPIDCYGNPIVF